MQQKNANMVLLDEGTEIKTQVMNNMQQKHTGVITLDDGTEIDAYVLRGPNGEKLTDIDEDNTAHYVLKQLPNENREDHWQRTINTINKHYKTLDIRVLLSLMEYVQLGYVTFISIKDPALARLTEIYDTYRDSEGFKYGLSKVDLIDRILVDADPLLVVDMMSDNTSLTAH